MVKQHGMEKDGNERDSEKPFSFLPIRIQQPQMAQNGDTIQCVHEYYLFNSLAERSFHLCDCYVHCT